MNDKKQVERIRQEMEQDNEAELLSALLDAYSQEEGKDLLRVNRRFKGRAGYSATDKQINRMLKNLRKGAAPKRASRKIVALVAALLIAMLTVTASACRADIANFLLTLRNDYLSVHTGRGAADKYVVFSELPLPGYIPAGFEQIDQIELSGITKVFYSNGQAEIIYIIYDAQTAMDIDTEGAAVEQQRWRGVDAYIIEKNRQLTVFWGNEPTLQLVGSSKLRAELIQMAQSVVFPSSESDVQK